MSRSCRSRLELGLLSQRTHHWVLPPLPSPQAPEVVADICLCRSLSIVEQFLSMTRKISLKHGSIAEMLENLILPGIQHRNAKIRQHALRCLGLCSLADLDFARQNMVVIKAMSEVDANLKVKVRCCYSMQTYWLGAWCRMRCAEPLAVC